MIKVNYLKAMVSLLLILIMSSCNDDDEQLEIWEVEVGQLSTVTAPYANFTFATNAGLIDVSGYVPNMGHHFLNPGLADGVFEIDKPEIILYVPDANNVMQMVGVEYSIIPADPNNPGSPPEGFTGDQDVWHFNDIIKEWQLHVWTVLEKPDGTFATFNPAIGD